MTVHMEHTLSLKNRQALVAQYFSELGSWYHRSSAEHQGEQVERVLDNLYDDFATFVLSLPANEYRIRRLWTFARHPDEISLSPGPRLSTVIADLQNGNPKNFDTFLNSLVRAAIGDTVDCQLNSVNKVFINYSSKVEMEKNSGTM